MTYRSTVRDWSYLSYLFKLVNIPSHRLVSHLLNILLLRHDDSYQLLLSGVSLNIFFSYGSSLVTCRLYLHFHYRKEIFNHTLLLLFNAALDVDCELLLSHPSCLHHNINLFIKVLLLVYMILHPHYEFFSNGWTQNEIGSWDVLILLAQLIDLIFNRKRYILRYDLLLVATQLKCYPFTFIRPEIIPEFYLFSLLRLRILHILEHLQLACFKIIKWEIRVFTFSTSLFSV